MDESALTHAFNKAANPIPANPSTSEANTSLSVSDFDVEAFLHHFDEFEMTEDEKHEVLHALWEIMCRFVEVGFGLDSHSLALKAGKSCESFSQNTATESGDLL